MNDLITKIQSELPGFSKGQKQIARFILEHYDKAAFMTASRLGVTVGVSESTVVRFATELGYDGYPHLQRALQEMIRNKLTSVQRMEVAGDRMGGRDVLQTVLYGCILAGWHDHARYADDDSRTVRGCGYDWRCKLVREGHGVGAVGRHFGWPRAGGWHYTRAARHHAVPLCGCPRSRRHTGCLCRRRYRQLLRGRCYAMGGSERNRQRLARQTESTWECHPRTGRGNADAVL